MNSLINKLRVFLVAARVCGMLAAMNGSALATDALLGAWMTNHSGLYARVVETNGGSMVSTWPAAGLANMGGGQSLPAYADIQQIRYSSDYVYVNGNGLASHQMGPWYLAVGQIFGNWPKNQNFIRRFPRYPQAATSHTVNGLGSIGLWVNGVAFFNLLDGYSYQNSTSQDVANSGDGIWVRNAVAVEVTTFDKSNAHQPPSGEYHYHNNPAALRLQLGDNIKYDSQNAQYVEDASNLHHSPILGWGYDGYPVYGPYGYSDATNASSGVRRMISGFVLRDGAHGTVDLASTGRHTLAAWSATLHGLSQTLTSGQYGPNVSATFALGRYVEDFDFLGDHGGGQGTDYDLDIYNGRWCVTPEFPQGTYAYFVTINSDGSSAFPYTIGRQYYGVPSGGDVQQITETLTNYFVGGTNLPASITNVARASNGNVNLGWQGFEGAQYTLQVSSNLNIWYTLATNVTTSGASSQFTETAASQAGASKRFYRVLVSGVSAYDAAGNGGSATGGGTGNITLVQPSTGARGANNVLVTITLNANAVPPLPPAMVVPSSVSVGGIPCGNIGKPNSTTVTALLSIPAGTAVGPKTVSVTFTPGPTYTLDGGFMVQ